MDDHTPLPLMHGFVVLGRDPAYIGEVGDTSFNKYHLVESTTDVHVHVGSFDKKLKLPVVEERSRQEGTKTIPVLYLLIHCFHA